MDKKLISLIIPCHNEEESLPYLYKELQRVSKEMPNYDFELLFIDDGSTDSTVDVVKGFAENDNMAGNGILTVPPIIPLHILDLLLEKSKSLL